MRPSAKLAAFATLAAMGSSYPYHPGTGGIELRPPEPAKTYLKKKCKSCTHFHKSGCFKKPHRTPWSEACIHYYKR